MGMIYQRGKTWWIKYYRNGKCYRESSKSTKKMVAKKLLDSREGEIAQGKMPSIQFDKVTFDELADGFLRDYRINQKKSLVRAERSVNHLKAFLEGARAAEITTPIINQYVELRMDFGAANATINRELAALKRMLNLGAEQTPPLVDKGRIPKIRMLDENNVRKGFFEHDQFLAVRAALPEYLRGFMTIAYKEGWRLDEIETLTWDQVDRNSESSVWNPVKRKTMTPGSLTSMKKKKTSSRSNGNFVKRYLKSEGCHCLGFSLIATAPIGLNNFTNPGRKPHL